MSFEGELRDQFAEADLAGQLDGGSLDAVKARAKQRTLRTRAVAAAAIVAAVVGVGIGLTALANMRVDDFETLDDAENSVVEDGESGETERPDDVVVETSQVSDADFSYIGSFLVPTDGNGEEGPSRFSFGGAAAAVDPQGDPDGTDEFSGSMFMTGFPTNAQVAEISIPAPVPHNGTADGLPVAQFLQPFSDVTDGRATTFVGSEEANGSGVYRIGGLEVLDGPGGRRLHWTTWQQFDNAAHDNPGHGHSSLDLSAPDPQGPWFVGDFEGYETAGYLFAVPEDFANESLGGRELISGFRDIMSTFPSTSQGSPFFAFTPPASAEPESRIEGPLELANYEAPDQELDGFRDTAVAPGASWVSTSDGRGAVVTVGNENTIPDVRCESAGQRPLEDFGPEIRFYDPADLAAVAAGSAEASDIAPYRTWDPTDDLIPTCGVQIASISFDADAGRVYIVQLYADTSRSEFDFNPVIHVWDID